MTVFTAIVALSAAGPDNRGKEFFLAFMENASMKRYLEILVTTPCKHDVIVRLTAPKWPAANLNKTFVVKPGTTKRIAFSNSLRLTGTGLSSKAVHLAADDEIVVITVNREDYTIGTCLALPVDVLGTAHFAVSYSPASNKCQVAVVGTRDHTDVDITLPSVMTVPVQLGDNSTYYGGETFRITLNAFDTFQLQSSGDLTGAKIVSSKPVSVFSGNVRTIVGGGISYDHIVEQLAPADTWGTVFITTPTPNRTTGDFFKIVSCQDNTSLVFNLALDNSSAAGQSETTYLLENAGDFVQVRIPSKTYVCLRSTKPIQVFQIVLSQMSRYSDEEADPSLTVIPPVYQWMSDYYFATPSLGTESFDNFVSLVVESTQRAGVLLNGVPVDRLGAKWTMIEDTTLAATSLLAGRGMFHVQHALPNVSFLCLVYGKALSQGYGFSAGMRLLPIAQPCNVTLNKQGDGLDNDCDGLVDEELCEDISPTDDDNDGEMDEDCATPLAINGGWSLWSEWHDCSATPGQSMQTRTRACNSPPAMFGGLPCCGPSEQSASCTSSYGLPSASYISSTTSLSSSTERQTYQPAVSQTTWSVSQPTLRTNEDSAAVLLGSFEPDVYTTDGVMTTQSISSPFIATGLAETTFFRDIIAATSIMATLEQTPGSSAVLLGNYEPDLRTTDDIIMMTQTLSSTFKATGWAETTAFSHDIIVATSVIATTEQTPDGLHSPVENQTVSNNNSHPPATSPLCKQCPCKTTATAITATTGIKALATNQEDEEQRWADIVRALALDRKSLSSSVRKKRSVRDPRLSSAVLGVSGVLVLVFTVLFVCCMDFRRLLQDIRATLRHARSAWNGRRGQMT